MVMPRTTMRRHNNTVSVWTVILWSPSGKLLALKSENQGCFQGSMDLYKRKGVKGRPFLCVGELFGSNLFIF